MKKLLIVVDMQNDFIDGALGTGEAVAILDGAVDMINGFDGDIIATYDTHGEDYLDTPEGIKLPVRHCIKGESGWQLNPKVESALAARGFLAVEKNIFGSTELPEIIKKRFPDNEEIYLLGLCTDICVVSNAIILKNVFPEKKIAVYSSLCAGVTPESHKAALTVMASCQIDIL